jgi:Hypothetical protein (DUF2513)/Restriction endonuclease
MSPAICHAVAKTAFASIQAALAAVIMKSEHGVRNRGRRSAMKRDLNLVRELVLMIEDSPKGWAPELCVEGYSQSQVGYHAHLLIEAGLARGVDVTNLLSESPQSLITDLTWAGHEFAELARDEDRWSKTISTITKGSRAITFEALRVLLASPAGPSPDVAQRGYQFEREVAAIYRALGARVEQDVVLAGNQIDIFVEEETSSGTKLRTAVECKAYSRPVGVDVVNQFASLIALLKQRGIVDRGALVTSQGFTNQARAAGKDLLEMLEISDLQQRVRGKTSELKAAEVEIDEARRKAAKTVRQPPRIFVLMPFASEFGDVYLLGIREVAEQLGFVVDRADDIEHNENVLDVIERHIRQCDVVVADMSGRNANVFYEIGYARALDRPTILICRKAESVPFDLQSINYIAYGSIVDLRDRLKRRLKTLMERSDTSAAS